MGEEAPRALWAEIDCVVEHRFALSDVALERTLEAGAHAGLPDHSISAVEGMLLQLLARIQGASSILELGTLAGYSTIWLARALPPGGRLISLEIDSARARLARANVEEAGLSELVEIRAGDALDGLREMLADGAGPFDLVFLDADKQSNPEYLELILDLSRPGTVIVADNVIRAGSILDSSKADPVLGEEGLRGLRAFHQALATDPRISATVVQTVGRKGHDGFALALVEARASDHPRECSSDRHAKGTQMHMDLEERLDQLESREAIRDLIAGYCQGLDNHELEQFVDLWHPDAEMLFGEPLGDFHGRDEIRRAIAEVIWPGLPETHHWTTNVVIRFADRDRAESLSDLGLVALTDEGTYVSISATYRDIFERRGGSWRFSRRHCVIHHRFPIADASDNELGTA